MSGERLTLLTPETAQGEAVKALSSVNGHMNVFRGLAHAETCILPVMRLGGAILSKQELSHVHREMLILVAMQIEGGEYEWVQHVDVALGVGISQAQIDAIAARDLDGAVFDEAERALLAFGAAVVETVRVPDEVFAAARAHFSERELVEAIVAMGFYMTLARVTEAGRVPLDAPQGMAVFTSAGEKRDGSRSGDISQP